MSNTYDLLTRQIEAFFMDLKKANPFYTSVFNGTVRKSQIVQMLRDLTYLTSNTPEHLRVAALEAQKRKDKVLSKYFQDKAGDEVDHDKWGEKDLLSLTGESIAEADVSGVSKGMLALVKANRQMITKDPFKYFVYILFAEYFTVYGAPDFLSAVRDSCGIPEEYMSIIANHAELDKHHVRDWEKELATLGEGRFSMKEFQETMLEVCKRYDEFAKGLAA